nr:ribosomal protein L7Ae/L30e/S12e/Gadd45 [Tanacetum cinerariifolium]
EGPVTRIHHDKVVDVEKNYILTHEIVSIMKTWVKINQENIFCLGGNSDHVSACLCHMLYYIARSERYNLAYFIAKRMEFITKQPRLIVSYSMLLTLLFKYVLSESLELSNDRYVLCDRVMYPLTAQQELKTRKDYGTRRGHSSTSFSSTFGQPSSSHPNDDDNDGNDEGASRASTPSPTRFVNSLSNDIPQIISNPPNVDPNMDAFYSRQTKILNQKVKLRDEQHGGIRSIGKGIKNLLRGKKKK